VEMALEAGVQLFEGRAFVVEDFEIRKPLILPEPVSEFTWNCRTILLSARSSSRVSSSTAPPGP